MEPDRTLLLVGHPTEAVRKAKSFGLHVILFQHKSKFEQEQAELADVLFLVDYLDWSVTGPLAELAHERWGFAAAVSLTDPGLEVAGRINDRYGLGGTGYHVSNLLRDKGKMRHHLRESGADTIGAERFEGEAGMRAFGERYGYPFIVKPVDLAGGFGVLKVAGPDDVARVGEAVSRMRDTGMNRGPAELFTIADFVMEEYVDGPEFSVETFSFDGRHVVVAVTEKSVEDAHFAELGHTVPARIDSRLEERLVTATSDFLDAVGLRDGPSHTELRVGKRGPSVIESHNRIGGDRIMDLVEAVYGVDFVSYAVAWPFRLVEPLRERPRPHGGACVRFLRGEPGTVAELDGLTELGDRAEVLAADAYVKVGDTVGGLRDDFDRLGLVAVMAADADSAAQQCEELVEKSVGVRIDPE